MAASPLLPASVLGRGGGGELPSKGIRRFSVSLSASYEAPVRRR